MTLKKGIVVANAPGTIDSDYTGEIGVILTNIGRQAVIIQHGERIAQLVFCEVGKANFKVVEEFDETERGSGGFGSTGFA